MGKMVATLPEVNHTEGNAKLKVNCDNFYKGFKAIAPVPDLGPGEYETLVDLRLYWTPSRVYARVWIRGGGHYHYGQGMAGGYGYDKESAAAGDAIGAAGVGLSEDIGGRGESAIEEALQAIAAALGYPDALLIKSHG